MKATLFLWAAIWIYSSNCYSQYLVVRGSVPLTPREDVAVAGTNAFAVGANSLSIVSFSNPQSPTVIGQVAPGVGTLSAVDVRGDYAYCAGQGSGVVVIDISTLSSPEWVRNVQAASAIKDVSISDTFLAAATGLNVTFYGLRNPSQPHLLTTFGRAANRVVVDSPSRKIHCAGATGAFVLSWTVTQGNVTLSAFDEFGSSEFTSVALGDDYTNVAQGLQFSALDRTTYSLSGQYGASGQIRAVASGSNFSLLGLATGGVEYLHQTADTPQLASSVQATSGVNGLAISDNEQWVIAATGSGVTIIESAPLGIDPVTPIPSEIFLSAFPNPFNSSTTVSWAGLLHSPATLSVYDLLGREVFTQNVLPSNGFSNKIDFSLLTAGSYLVRLNSSEVQTAPLRIVYLP